MILQNPFSDDVRLIYLYSYECWICKENGTRSGGIELHHILGRVSDSVLNSAPLCKFCHDHIGHSFEEEKDLLQKTIRYLVRHGYTFTDKDIDFYNEHKNYYN